MKTRRQFIKRMSGLLSGVALIFNPLFKGVRVAFAKAKKVILPKGTRMKSLIDKNPASLDARNLDLTPVDAFETMGLDDHDVVVSKWRLQIDGLMHRSMKLTYRQIMEMPSIERNVLLICPGFFAYHAHWKGVSVGKLLETAGMAAGATSVAFRGPEGSYEKTEQFPIEDVLSDKVFLAYRVNGEILPQKHGFPIRVVAEDYYGGVWVKYVAKVTVNKS